MKQFNILYLTTNLVNGKIYVGKHSTDNLDDGYIGSGDCIAKAIAKYGKDNFTCEPIFFAFTEQGAYEAEAMIVTDEFINRPDVYNKVVGGKGFGSGASNPQFGKQGVEHPRMGKTHSVETKQYLSHIKSGESNPRYGVEVSAETRKKISDSKLKARAECPHCSKVGGLAAMSRWHFDNCKSLGL